MNRCNNLLALAALTVSITGCGNGLAEVTGLVTLDGEPLRGGNGVRATVYFQPASGSGATASAILDENGRYTLSTASEEGVQPGDYIVTCSASQLIPPKDPSGTPGGRRITDPKYASAQTSGLKFTVGPGANEFNISLQSHPTVATQRRSG